MRWLLLAGLYFGFLLGLHDFILVERIRVVRAMEKEDSK
jgi:hypothetical protein